MPLKITPGVPGAEDDLGTLESLAGALVVGPRRDPLLKPAIDAIGQVFGADSAQLDELEARLQTTSLGRTASTVAEYATQVGLAVGTGGLGRAALYGVVRAQGARLATRGAASVLGRQGARIEARLASERALATGLGEVAPAGGVTALERAGQIAGTSGGEALLGGAQAAARGEDVEGILTGAAFNAALAGGGELGLIGAARALGAVPALGLTRGLDVGQARVNALPARIEIQRAIQRGESQVLKLRDTLEETLGVRTLEAETIEAMRGRARVAQAAYRGAREQGANVTRAQVFEMLDARTPREIRAGINLEKRAARQTRVNESLDTFERGYDLLPDDRILRTRALNPETELGQGVRKVLQRIVEAPEAAAGKLGVTTTKLVADVGQVEEMLPAIYAAVDAQSLRGVRSLAATLGRPVPRTLRDADGDDVLRGAFEMAEERGLDAVGEVYGAEARTAMQALTQANDDAFQVFVQRGVAARIDDATLAQLGVRQYFPQVLADGDLTAAEAQLARYLEQRLGDPLEAQRGARRTVRSVGTFGSLDYQRFLPGTLAEKVRAGVPFLGYAEGIAQYQRRLARRNLYGERFGYTNNEVTRFTDVVKLAATREGANVRLVNSLVDSLFDTKYEQAAGRRLAQTITSSQTAVKLPLAFIPNMAQSASTAITFGIGNLMRGVRAAVGAETDDTVLRALAFGESVELDTMRRLIAGVEGENLADRVASGVLKATGFSAIESWNRRFAGFTTQASVNDTLARALGGKLRGTRLDAARRSFQQLGLDLDRLVRTDRVAVSQALSAGRDLSGVVDAVMGPGSYGRAIARGVNFSQSLPSRTRIPLAWQTPVGRVLTQFKSFAFNQGRLIRDRVIGEAAVGNVRPLVTMAAIYPLAGELVADTLAVAKGRQREENGLERVLANVSMMGGFGLVQAAATGAKYGRLSDVVAGPTVSDALSLAEGVYQLVAEQESRQVLKQASRQPIVQAATIVLGGGVGVGDALLEYVNSGDDDDTPVSFDSWSSRIMGGASL